MSILGTVAPERIWQVYALLPWLEAATMAVFLLASVRLAQAGATSGTRWMGVGFGLLVGARLYDGALQAALIPMSYLPGVPGAGWGEAAIWWGQWAARLAGPGFAVLGCFLAGRGMVREARRRPHHAPLAGGGHG